MKDQKAEYEYWMKLAADLRKAIGENNAENARWEVRIEEANHNAQEALAGLEKEK